MGLRTYPTACPRCGEEPWEDYGHCLRCLESGMTDEEPKPENRARWDWPEPSVPFHKGDRRD